MAIFGTFHHKLGDVWSREYIADNGEVFYLRRRAGDQLVFIAVDTLYCAEGKKNNAVVEYPAVAQMDADCNEHCTIERAGRLLRLNAKDCRFGSCELEWHERRKIIDNIKG